MGRPVSYPSHGEEKHEDLLFVHVKPRGGFAVEQERHGHELPLRQLDAGAIPDARRLVEEELRLDGLVGDLVVVGMFTETGRRWDAGRTVCPRCLEPLDRSASYSHRSGGTLENHGLGCGANSVGEDARVTDAEPGAEYGTKDRGRDFGSRGHGGWWRVLQDEGEKETNFRLGVLKIWCLSKRGSSVLPSYPTRYIKL